MTAGLRRELISLALWLVFMLGTGWLVGQVVAFMLAALAMWLSWYLYQINRLLVWLGKPSRQVPEARGVWDEVYYQLYNLYKRQRKARKKLTSILARFQSSTEALPYATIVLDKNNRIEWFNPAAKNLFELSSNADIGQRIDNLVRLPVFVQYLNARQYDEPLEFDYMQRKLRMNITPYGSGQFLLTARDVTSRRKLDDMRRDFISNASHELRTPVTVIAGYLEALSDNVDEATRKPLQKIQQQTRRMQTIIDDLIELARLESPVDESGLDVVDANAVLGDVYQEAAGIDQGRHRLDLRQQDSDAPSEITGHYNEVRTALLNLVTNAIRYTPENGRITLFLESDEQTVMLGVEDNGPGIAYEHIPRLTERFYRVDAGRSREQGGSGLGLAIVKHILDRHNASLFVRSKSGKGSQFRCDFPRAH